VGEWDLALKTQQQTNAVYTPMSETKHCLGVGECTTLFAEKNASVLLSMRVNVKNLQHERNMSPISQGTDNLVLTRRTRGDRMGPNHFDPVMTKTNFLELHGTRGRRAWH
jgi:hypothetical protein